MSLNNVWFVKICWDIWFVTVTKLKGSLCVSDDFAEYDGCGGCDHRDRDIV